MGQDHTINWAGATRSGSRKERNDDAWIVFAADANGSRKLSETDSASIAEQDLVFAVSDGMSGGNAGDMASALIVEMMAKLIPETFRAAAKGFFPDSLAHLEKVLGDVHTHINRAALASDDCSGMAATLALAWFSPENMYLANVGDSRIYRCRNGVTEQLSKDHTSAWGQLQRGEITEVEYRNHPRRAALYRIIGGGKTMGAPHFAAVRYEPGDRFLICSDGLIDGVWERHIREALAEGSPPAVCCAKLLERALANAGGDDTTLVVMSVS